MFIDVFIKVAFSTKKSLCAVKGMSDVKVDKLLAAASNLVAMGFRTVGRLNLLIVIS